jgi:hypothetical protein
MKNENAAFLPIGIIKFDMGKIRFAPDIPGNVCIVNLNVLS